MTTAKTRRTSAPTKRQTAAPRKAVPRKPASRKAAPRKPVGKGLQLGLNAVDPRHYDGWDGSLKACENDARDMSALASQQGIASRVLLTAQATRAKVLQALRADAKELKSGDFYFLSYSGHGGQIPDVSHDETDKQDETWCLYDGELIDDELYLELSRFRPGVRVLVLSDSCHSGTVTRELRPPSPSGGGLSRLMPSDVGFSTYRKHKTFYDNLQKQVAEQTKKGKGRTSVDPDTALAHVAVSPRLDRIAAKTSPAVILLSGCQDNQTSSDGRQNGVFTGQVLKAWKHGAFRGNYAQFLAIIKAGMPSDQTPNLYVLGKSGAFVRQRPFQVDPAAVQATPKSALAFLGKGKLPAPPRRALGIRALGAETDAAAVPVFDQAKNQSVVSGASVLSFTAGVPEALRATLTNCTLYAQLLARKQVPGPEDSEAWYGAYFDTLSNLGWLVQDAQFSEYNLGNIDTDVHEAIGKVAALLLGGGVAALALVTTALDALKSMDASTPWITLFNRESSEANVAKFQVGLVEQADGQTLISLIAIALMAQKTVVQVLFFKFKKEKASLRQRSSKFSVSTDVLQQIGPKLTQILAAHAMNSIQLIP